MTSSFKLAVAATVAAPAAMSVRSAELSSLKPAFSPSVPARNLDPTYAGTDARIIAADALVVRRGGTGVGLASNVESGWQRNERTRVVTRDERPLVSVETACEQQQVEDMAQAMGTAGFAGMHGYPSWRTRT